MDWVVINRTRIEIAMPVALRTEYDAWVLAHPAKLFRIDGIVANLVAEFRTGLEANPENELDPDTTKLPLSCVRHCETLCLYDIAIEIGANVLEDEMAGVSKAEIFLRYMFSGRFFMTGGDERVEPTPRYGRPFDRDVRVLT